MSMQATLRAPRQSRLLMVTLAAVGAVVLWFIATHALRYTSYSQAAYGELWPRRFGLIPHILGGVVAITTGLVQLWLGLTGRTKHLHRLLGRVYLGTVTVGSLAGFYLAITSTDGPVFGSGLFFLSAAWALTTAMAFVAIRDRAIEQHREWMLRSYVVTFAFVTFRLFDTRLMAHGVSEIDAVGIMAWACWAVPLLVLEPVLQIRKLRRR